MRAAGLTLFTQHHGGVNGLLQPDLRLHLARRMRSSLCALLLDLSAAVAVRTSVLLLLCVSCPTDARSMWQVRVPVKEPHARRCISDCALCKSTR